MCKTALSYYLFVSSFHEFSSIYSNRISFSLILNLSYPITQKFYQNKIIDIDIIIHTVISHLNEGEYWESMAELVVNRF